MTSRVAELSQFWEVYVDDLDIGEVVNMAFLKDLITR
jgi:hypothetical protein